MQFYCAWKAKLWAAVLLTFAALAPGCGAREWGSGDYRAAPFAGPASYRINDISEHAFRVSVYAWQYHSSLPDIPESRCAHIALEIARTEASQRQSGVEPDLRSLRSDSARGIMSSECTATIKVRAHVP